MKCESYKVCVLLLALGLVACVEEDKPEEVGANAGTPILGQWVTEACTRSIETMSDGRLDVVWTKGFYDFQADGRVDMSFYAHQDSDCTVDSISELIEPSVDAERYLTFYDRGLLPEQELDVRALDIYIPGGHFSGADIKVQGAYYVNEQQRLCFADNMFFNTVFWSGGASDEYFLNFEDGSCLIR